MKTFCWDSRSEAKADKVELSQNFSESEFWSNKISDQTDDVGIDDNDNDNDNNVQQTNFQTKKTFRMDENQTVNKNIFALVRSCFDLFHFYRESTSVASFWEYTVFMASKSNPDKQSEMML